MIKNIKTYTVLFSGRVQGVGFRYFTITAAEQFNMKGFVKNVQDGKVEIICQGGEEELKPFIEELKKGPAFSVITEVLIKEIPENKQYNSFEIKY